MLSKNLIILTEFVNCLYFVFLLYYSRGKPLYSIGGPIPKIPKLEMGLPVAEPEPKDDAVIIENGNFYTILVNFQGIGKHIVNSLYS